MPAITLPDGSVRHFDAPVTGTDGGGRDRPRPRPRRAGDEARRQAGRSGDRRSTATRSVVFVTRRDPEALELIRHDAAHVLAEAVQELYPGTQVTIGPAIENGFYYDFARNEPFTPEDFPAIEAKMREIVARDAPFAREVMGPRRRDRASSRTSGEKYKAELIQRPAGDRDDHALLARATGSISAAARTCAPPAMSATPSS